MQQVKLATILLAVASCASAQTQLSTDNNDLYFHSTGEFDVENGGTSIGPLFENIGHPRNARTTLSKGNAQTGTTFLYGFIPRSLAKQAARLERRSNGIRLGFSSDHFDAGISFHNTDAFEGSSLNIGYLAGKYRITDKLAFVTTAQIGIDQDVNANRIEFNNNIELGAIGSVGKFQGSLIYSNSQSNGKLKTWHASATYKFNARLSGTAVYSLIEKEDFNLASLGLEYNVKDTVALSASATDLNTISSTQRSYILGLGFNF